MLLGLSTHHPYLGENARAAPYQIDENPVWYVRLQFRLKEDGTAVHMHPYGETRQIDELLSRIETAADRDPDLPDPEEPISISEDVDLGPAPDPEDIARYERVVLGRVVEVMAPQWTTPDGERPADPWTTGYRIITPAVIELEQAPLVDSAGLETDEGERLVVATFGGDIDEDSTATSDPSQTLERDTRVILSLSEHPFHQGDVERRNEAEAGLAWNARALYRVTDDGIANPTHPLGESLPVEELIERIESGGQEGE